MADEGIGHPSRWLEREACFSVLEYRIVSLTGPSHVSNSDALMLVVLKRILITGTRYIRQPFKSLEMIYL